MRLKSKELIHQCIVYLNSSLIRADTFRAREIIEKIIQERVGKTQEASVKGKTAREMENKAM